MYKSCETYCDYSVDLNGVSHKFRVISHRDLRAGDGWHILSAKNWSLGKELKLGIIDLSHRSIEFFQDDAKHKETFTAKIYLKHTPSLRGDYGIAIHNYRHDPAPNDEKLKMQAIADMFLLHFLNPSITSMSFVVELRRRQQICKYEYSPTGDQDDVSLSDPSFYTYNPNSPIIP